jgi:SlyX protein
MDRMSEIETLSARIDALEMRIAYQDQTIEDLNNTVVAQWKQIDALTRHMASLADRILEAEDHAGGRGSPEPPPPHY